MQNTQSILTSAPLRVHIDEDGALRHLHENTSTGKRKMTTGREKERGTRQEAGRVSSRVRVSFVGAVVGGRRGAVADIGKKPKKCCACRRAILE